jgi:16S rRNA (cytidine1402-2'-O)-methyltransferase
MNARTLPGTLYVVATPLGNLEDISFRAVNILKHVDLIAAEDTRHSGRLLSRYNIETRVVSCHEHNEKNKISWFISKLEQGLDIALISDAGTPTISDPGYRLVAAAVQSKISIIPVPGCNAAIAGLSVSGLATDSFIFLGFLPRKQQKLMQALEDLKSEPRTLICYESPHRIKNLVNTMVRILGNRKACLAREITKLHEEYIRAGLEDILADLKARKNIKGECSLFVQGCIKDKKSRPDEKELEKIIIEHIKSQATPGTSRLARQLSEQFNLPRKKIYEMILRLS